MEGGEGQGGGAWKGTKKEYVRQGQGGRLSHQNAATHHNRYLFMNRPLSRHLHHYSCARTLSSLHLPIHPMAKNLLRSQTAL
ncbi:hypothetical protein Pcinc_006463 [Petrolisthes cinctipes]|uniref:Uncharacterized protein n=1 Tax=Petrolisthes cinctipes TaxID=88211 RepID=A0AAE1KXX9_PETCI|nr:hypothetical protein Pcinc_006463 [Petrolisthes cinctipes]